MPEPNLLERFLMAGAMKSPMSGMPPRPSVNMPPLGEMAEKFLMAGAMKSPMTGMPGAFVDPMVEKQSRDESLTAITESGRPDYTPLPRDVRPDPRELDALRRRRLIEQYVRENDEPYTEESALRMMQAREARKRALFGQMLQNLMGGLNPLRRQEDY